MRYILVGLLIPLTLFANTAIDERSATENKPIKEESPIKKLIEQIQNAKAKERRVLINQLKVKLRASNQKQKEKSMIALKKAFSKQNNNSHNAKHIQLKVHRREGDCNMNHQNHNIHHQPKFRSLREQRGSTENSRNNNIQPNRGDAHK